MSSCKNILVVSNIKLPVDASEKEAFSVARQRLKKLRLLPEDAEFSIYRKSVDARRRDDLHFVVSVAVSGGFSSICAKADTYPDISFVSQSEPEIKLGKERLDGPIVVVGSGPAGLFLALMLAESGYAPIVIERGGSVAERTNAVRVFNENHILDTENNIQFGAGGAGTFSDGKLITRVNDPLSAYVMRRFVEFGAPEEIKYLAKPHIGTDVLAVVVDRMIGRIEELGGRVMYRTRLDEIKILGSRAAVAVTNKGEIPSGAIVLAVGHSARDTYKMLLSKGFAIEPKPFSVGMRIEHLSEDIDSALYGRYAGSPNLGHAEYSLSTNTKVRGVYTFCMCPGGEVVAAASEDGGVVVNGMSRHARDGRNSNSAVVSSVFTEDYGNTPGKAIDFQQKIEQRAFISGGGDFCAPIITVGDFLDGKCKTEPKRVIPTYMSGGNVQLKSPLDYLPVFAVDGIKNALQDFDRKINGFASPDAVLTGAETRTSAPVRIMRSASRCALGYDNIYPVGEGAGYAGGITSAAIDGIKTALSIMEKYAPATKKG